MESMTCKSPAIEINMNAEKELPKAEQIIAEESQRFMQALNHRTTGPVIQQLRTQAQELKRDELQRLINKLESAGLDPAVNREIEKSFDRLINKLFIHHCLRYETTLRKVIGTGLLEAAQASV